MDTLFEEILEELILEKFAAQKMIIFLLHTYKETEYLF